MVATAPQAPTTFDVLVDSHVGLITVEVTARTYGEAYRGAVEALLRDPHGVIAHKVREIHAELYG